MIRSPLRLLAALALVALTLVVVACGSSSDDSGGTSSRRRRATARHHGRARRAASSTQLGASDVDFLDPGQTYYTAASRSIYATQTPLYCPSPTQDEADAGSRRRRAADLRRQQDGHGQAQEGRQVRPAGQPRGQGEGRQVRVRAAAHRERRRTSTRRTSTSSRATRRSRARCQDISGHRDAGRPVQSCSSSTQAEGRRVRRRR